MLYSVASSGISPSSNYSRTLYTTSGSYGSNAALDSPTGSSHGSNSALDSVSISQNMTLDPICEVSDWGDWGSCTVTCDTGTMQRSRSITSPLPCVYVPLQQTRACTTDCPASAPAPTLDKSSSTNWGMIGGIIGGGVVVVGLILLYFRQTKGVHQSLSSTFKGEIMIQKDKAMQERIREAQARRRQELERIERERVAKIQANSLRDMASVQIRV